MKLTIGAIFLFLSNFVFAQTKLTIIGSQHTVTNHENPDSVLKVLKKIKPDVILIELDTALMDPKGNFKGRAITATSNENNATRAYKLLNPNLIIRRFDIEERSFYYDSHRTFATENKLFNTLDSMYRKNLLDEDSKKTVTDYYDLNNRHNNLSQSDLATLNSPDYKNLSKQRQQMLYKDNLEVIKKTPGLKMYYEFFKDDGEFWDRRNKAMIQNILNYIKSFEGKNIVVLTGAMHTYYLTGGLVPVQGEYRFKLNDLPKAK